MDGELASAANLKIPIRNLYYLFCYAWALYRPGLETEVGVEDCPDVPNLFALMLVSGANKLIRRGLNRGYIERYEESRAPRGHLLVDVSIKTASRSRASIWCEFDELTRDVLHNRIIKATAIKLARHPKIEKQRLSELQALVRRLSDVSDIRLASQTFQRIQLVRQTASYAAILRLCEFIFRAEIPSLPGAGDWLAGIEADDKTMSSVFEEFLRNFYRFEQAAFLVRRENMRWEVRAEQGSDASLVPIMRTDITLRSKERSVVIDAKYYSEPFIVRSGVRKLRSAHLYQIYAYVKNLQRRDPHVPAEGFLVYAAPACGSQDVFVINGHRVMIAAVDLTRPWLEVRLALLGLINDNAHSMQLGTPQS